MFLGWTTSRSSIRTKENQSSPAAELQEITIDGHDSLLKTSMKDLHIMDDSHLLHNPSLAATLSIHFKMAQVIGEHLEHVRDLA